MPDAPEGGEQSATRFGPTPAQLGEIRAALDAARAAQAAGGDPQPHYDRAEALMVKYGAGEEPHLDEDGNP